MTHIKTNYPQPTTMGSIGNLGAADRITASMAPDRLPLVTAPGSKGARIMASQLDGSTQSSTLVRDFLPQGTVPSNAFTSAGTQLTWLFPKSANRDIDWIDDVFLRIKLLLSAGTSPTNDLITNGAQSFINRFEVYVNGNMVDVQYPSQTYFAQRFLAETSDENLGALGDLVGFDETTTRPNMTITANGGTATLYLPLRGFFSRDAGGTPFGLRGNDEIKIVVYCEANRWLFSGTQGATTLTLTEIIMRLVGRQWHDASDRNSLIRQLNNEGDWVRRFMTSPAPISTTAGAWTAGSENKILMTQSGELMSHLWIQVKTDGTQQNDTLGTQLAGYQYFDPSGQRLVTNDTYLADRYIRSYVMPNQLSGRFMVDAASGNTNKYHYLMPFGNESEKAITIGQANGLIRTSGSDNVGIYPNSNFTGTEVILITPVYLRQARYTANGVFLDSLN